MQITDNSNQKRKWFLFDFTSSCFCNSNREAVIYNMTKHKGFVALEKTKGIGFKMTLRASIIKTRHNLTSRNVWIQWRKEDREKQELQLTLSKLCFYQTHVNTTNYIFDNALISLMNSQLQFPNRPNAMNDWGHDCSWNAECDTHSRVAWQLRYCVTHKTHLNF